MSFLIDFSCLNSDLFFSIRASFKNIVPTYQLAFYSWTTLFVANQFFFPLHNIFPNGPVSFYILHKYFSDNPPVSFYCTQFTTNFMAILPTKTYYSYSKISPTNIDFPSCKYFPSNIQYYNVRMNLSKTLVIFYLFSSFPYPLKFQLVLDMRRLHRLLPPTKVYIRMNTLWMHHSTFGVPPLLILKNKQ